MSSFTLPANKRRCRTTCGDLAAHSTAGAAEKFRALLS